MMKLLKLKVISLSLIFLFPLLGFSQDQVWQVDLKEDLYEVGWIDQSNDGIIIAAGSKGLAGLDNTDGKLLWKNDDFKGVQKSAFSNIDGLPLFFFTYTPQFSSKERAIIMNARTGEVLYNTKEEGYKIMNYDIFPQNGKILFELIREKERFLLSFSLKDWKEEWIAPLGKNKGLLNKLLGRSFIDQGPTFNSNNAILIAIDEQLYAIDGATGKSKWQYEADKDIKAMVYSESNNSLYLGIRKSKKLKVLNPDNGEDITPGKLKLRGTLIDVRPDADGNLILVETEGFNIIEPATNTFKWKKSFKLPLLEEVIPHPKGFIAVAKSEDESVIALVDKNGDDIWDAKAKGYAYYVSPTSKGILYISTERANILDFKKGKDVWDKDVKFKSIPAVTFDDKEDKVVLFENKKGYKFDLNSGAIDFFAEKIELEEVKKKTPLLAEYVEGAGYLLYTGQHMSLLSPSGKVKYTKYFEPASSIKGLTQLAQVGLNVAGVDLDIAGSMANIQALTALTNGSTIVGNDQTEGSVEESNIAGLYTGSGGNMNAVFEITKQRYSNSKDLKGFKFVVTKLGEGKHAIYMIEKASGKVIKQIDIMDKTPNYFIDEIDSVVFLNEKNHLISAYKF
jgi:outer membrane protein assembly factor BamB